MLCVLCVCIQQNNFQLTKFRHTVAATNTPSNAIIFLFCNTAVFMVLHTLLK